MESEHGDKGRPRVLRARRLWKPVKQEGAGGYCTERRPVTTGSSVLGSSFQAVSTLAQCASCQPRGPGARCSPGRPFHLWPCGFHLRACLVMLAVGFQCVWPIHLQLFSFLSHLLQIFHPFIVGNRFQPVESEDPPQAALKVFNF